MNSKTCEKCGKAFGCEGTTACWCMNVKLDDAARDRLMKDYNDCLCSECLSEMKIKI